MQLAILLVLIVIAIILAPWLLGLVAVVIAALGFWLLISLVAAVVVSLLVIGFIVVSGSSKPVSSKTVQIITEVNEEFRAKEVAKMAAARASAAIKEAEIERVKKVRVVECPNCSATIAKHSLYCPQCGKSTKPRSALND